ncbi:MAG: J domain-containing protein [Alphaproteobacteria bacterium]|nr:J domain-containing protein [Alphaproteobacteria bacterium]
MTVSYYEILRVNPSASDEDVKRAYKHLAKKFHPDMNPRNRQVAELRFRAITEAYDHIKTREKRARYNQTLRLHAQNDNAARKSIFEAFGEFFMPAKRNTQRQT